MFSNIEGCGGMGFLVDVEGRGRARYVEADWGIENGLARLAGYRSVCEGSFMYEGFLTLVLSQ